MQIIVSYLCLVIDVWENEIYIIKKMKVFSGDTKSYHFPNYNNGISEVEKDREKKSP